MTESSAFELTPSFADKLPSLSVLWCLQKYHTLKVKPSFKADLKCSLCVDQVLNQSQALVHLENRMRRTLHTAAIRSRPLSPKVVARHRQSLNACRFPHLLVNFQPAQLPIHHARLQPRMLGPRSLRSVERRRQLPQTCEQGRCQTFEEALLLHRPLLLRKQCCSMISAQECSHLPTSRPLELTPALVARDD